MAEPSVVRRLSENGQTLRNVEVPASWRGGASFALDPDSRAALESHIDAVDEDGDGRIGLASSVGLFEDGVVIGQRPDLQLALEDDMAQLALELGLTRRGYEVLREVHPEPTGEEVVDAWLERAVDALVESMPPFRTGRRGGLLVGEGVGACVPALIAPPQEIAPEPAPDAAGA